MKLVPLLRFWGGKRENEESELPDQMPEELLQLPPEEQPTDSAESDAENEEQEKEEEEQKEVDGSRDDEMLKVFQEVEEEYVDNSGLVAEIENVPASELLQELHTLAAAFGIRTQRGTDAADPTA